MNDLVAELGRALDALVGPLFAIGLLSGLLVALAAVRAQGPLIGWPQEPGVWIAAGSLLAQAASAVALWPVTAVVLAAQVGRARGVARAWWSVAAAAVVVTEISVRAGFGTRVALLPVVVALVAGLPAVTVLSSRPVGGLLLLVSGTGLFATLPDTEVAVALLGAAAAPVGLAVAWRRGLGRIGTGAVTGYLAWAVVVGGIGRTSALVGGAACVAALALPALLGGQTRSQAAVWPRWAAPVLIVLHLAVVVAASRWVGLASGTAEALTRLALGAPLAVLAVAAWTWTVRRSSRVFPSA